jgi:outer membrane usher protein
MRPRASPRVKAVLGLLLAFGTPVGARSQDIPPPTAASVSLAGLQLEVFVNGTSTQMIAAFSRSSLDRLVINPEQLRNIGLLPVADARQPDGFIDVSKLPGVSYTYDEAEQTIHFTVENSALVERTINAGDEAAQNSSDDPSEPATAQTGTGALMNYTLYGSSGGQDVGDITDFQGLSAALEARFFSPAGVLTSSQIVSTSDAELFTGVRLDTTWSYSSESQMVTYRMGDITTGSLGWTRPVRLGGIQIQRNFALRPDLVTMPLPLLSGSAVVPSTVDVYVDNARRLTTDVPAGPFSITNLPFITGAGNARLVVHDALGRETVSETPFYVSADLLAPGLWDVSGEAGFARRSYATESFDYDEQPMLSATARVGATDWLTLEAHAEGGADLLNGGGGGVFNIGPFGIASVAGAVSQHHGKSGFLLSASVEADIMNLHVFARTQRTFGDYDDIASVTANPDFIADGIPLASARAPRVLDQISVSLPSVLDMTSLNVSYTQLETTDEIRSRLLGITANRALGERGNVFVTAYADVENRDVFGVFAGLSWSFGDDISAGTGISVDADGFTASADITKAEQGGLDSTGWRLRGVEGAHRSIAASGSYRSAIGRIEAGVDNGRHQLSTHVQLDGAVAVAGGGVFLSNRIDDAFGIVDAGVPDVAVELENRPAGRTGRNGKLLVTGLNAYDKNAISINPDNLSLDTQIETTRAFVTPRDRSGVVIDLGVRTDVKALLVILQDESGAFVEAGSSAMLDGAEQRIVVGYDGQAYLTGLDTNNRLIVDQPSKGRCVADLNLAALAAAVASARVAICRSPS